MELIVVRRMVPALLLGASLAALWFGSRESRSDFIYPSGTSISGWNAYDDRSRGGASGCKVKSLGDTLQAVVRLGSAPDAYWGIEWGPGILGNTPARYWKWSSRDSLVFHWRARHAARQRINVCSRDPDLTTPVDPLSRRYLTIDLPIGPEWTRAAFALADLEPPAWWLGFHPQLPNPRKPFLESVLVLQIGPASGAGEQDDTLEIASIERRPAGGDRILILLSGLGIAGAIALSIASRKTTRLIGTSALPPHLLPEPRRLEAPAPDLERLNRFLADNYPRGKLDLATVSAELRMPTRRVTTLLGSQGESFKATLNRLRLQEARRLVLETDLQISEIAFKVGYANVSHFNRLFRERHGSAPGALRTTSRNLHDPLQIPPVAETDKDSTDIA